MVIQFTVGIRRFTRLKALLKLRESYIQTS
jgi:hypothetical protein